MSIEPNKKITDKQVQNFKFILRRSCETRFVSSLKKQEKILISEMENHDDFLYGQWMSIILLSGPSLQATLKLHYYNSSAKHITATALGIDDHNVKDTMLMDHMKELTNLFAGEVKAQLFHNDILVGISLPLITRGFDEVLFSDRIGNHQVKDFWTMSSESDRIKVTVTTESEVFHPDIFEDVKFLEQNEEDEGEVDFL